MRRLEYTHKQHTISRANSNDAGIDFAADLNGRKTLTIPPGEIVTIGTGVSVAIDPGFVGLMFVRSSVGKRGLSLANGVGVIDSGYRGEVKVMLVNQGRFAQTIVDGERLAQLVIVSCELPVPWPVDGLDESVDGRVGGFGSTGR